jgi:hypothetical protein
MRTPYNPSSMSAETFDRRGSERFPIVRDVRYRALNRNSDSAGGTGKTVNMSSTGVLFSTQDHPMYAGKRLELSISWPARLDRKCGLKLVVRGRVVRCKGALAAIAAEKHEFRTVGSKGGLELLTKHSHSQRRWATTQANSQVFPAGR